MKHARDAVNLAALFGVQIANAALPLAVFPFLLVVAGQEMYSRVALSEAIALAVLTASLYSFDLDALSRVVGQDLKRDIDSISRAFSGVLLARLLIFFGAATVALLACLWLAPTLTLPLSWWLLLPLSHVLQSAWLFQGLEHNLPIALVTIVSRLTGLVLVLSTVQSSADYWLVPMLIGSTALVGALALLLYAHLQLGLRLQPKACSDVPSLLRQGRSVFLGNASVFMYRDLNVVLLAAAGAGPASVALYSVAEKLVKGIQATVRPINQFFFPKAVRAIQGRTQADRGALQLLARLIWPQLAAVAVVIVALSLSWWLLADRLPLLRDLPDRGAVVVLILIMLPAVFLGVVNFMLGSVGLNHLHQRDHLFFCLLGVGVSSIAVCALLSAAIGNQGTAAAFVLSELLLSVLVLRRYLRNTARPAPG